MDSVAGRKIANNLTWLVAQEIFARLSGVLLVILLARMLSTSDFGALNICMALMAMLSLLVRSGTGSRATRLTARASQNIGALHAEITGLRVAVAFAIILLTVLSARPLGALLSVSPPLLALSAGLLLRPALAVAWAFRGLDDMKPIALSAIGERAIVLGGVALLLTRQEARADTVLLLEILAGLAVVVFLRWRLYQLVETGLSIRPHPSRWGAMLRESWPISLAALTGSFYRHGDLILLGVLSGSSAAALYLIPQKIVLTLLVLPILIGKASFPSASRSIHPDRNAAVALQADLLRFTLLLLLPACTMAWFYSQELLELLFGTAYSRESATLRILLLTAPLFAFATFQENLLLAVPQPRTVMICRVMASAAHLLTSLLLIPRYGAFGAALGCLVGQSLFTLLSAAMWKGKHGRLPLQSRCVAPLLASLILVLVLWVSEAWLAPWQSAMLAVLLYIVTLVLLRGVDRIEIVQGLEYLRSRFSRSRATR